MLHNSLHVHEQDHILSSWDREAVYFPCSTFPRLSVNSGRCLIDCCFCNAALIWTKNNCTGRAIETRNSVCLCSAPGSGQFKLYDITHHSNSHHQWLPSVITGDLFVIFIIRAFNKMALLNDNIFAWYSSRVLPQELSSAVIVTRIFAFCVSWRFAALGVLRWGLFIIWVCLPHRPSSLSFSFVFFICPTLGDVSRCVSC